MLAVALLLIAAPELHTLPNGLRVVTLADPTLPVISLRLVYDVGAADDPPDKPGLAHLVEHLAFSPSQHMQGASPWYYFGRMSATGVNATTGIVDTAFFATVPSRDLDLALWLEADRMGYLSPALRQSQLEHERGVVQQEAHERREADLGAPVFRLSWEALFGQHPYGRVYRNAIDDVSLEEVRRFLAAYYLPSNAVLVLVGALPEDVLGRVEHYFGDIPTRARPERPRINPPALVQEVKLDELERESLAHVRVLWPAPGRGDAAGDVGPIVASALCNRLQRFGRPFLSCRYGALPAASYFSVEVAERRERGTHLLQEVDSSLEQLVQDQMPPEELASIRRELLRADLEELQTLESRAATLAGEVLYGEGIGYWRPQHERREAVSAEQVREFVETLLRAERRVVVLPGSAP